MKRFTQTFSVFFCFKLGWFHLKNKKKPTKNSGYSVKKLTILYVCLFKKYQNVCVGRPKKHSLPSVVFTFNPGLANHSPYIAKHLVMLWEQRILLQNTDFFTQETLWEQDSAAEEGLHLNPIPLRRPFCSTGAFRNKGLIIEANVTSNGGGQRAWSLYSGEQILFEGDIFTGYPWNRRLWLRKVPCVCPSPSWSHRKRIMLCTLHIPILIIFFVLQNQSFMVKGASIDVLWWVIQRESTHTHTHTKES